MDIPAKIRIEACLEQGAVFYFSSASFENPDIPHYFIVLNNKPKSTDVLALVYATSKVEKVKKRRKNCYEQTLIDISPDEYIGFSVSSIVDCNTVIEINASKLIEKLENKQLKICEKMPYIQFNLIKSGVLLSNLVEKRIKKMILPS